MFINKGHIAEDIGKDFPFARVDFYSVNKKVYFGEITFYPWSGMVQFQPDSFDFDMGDKFILPKEML
ncbi:ATP-grasp fold amidoligase family protein [Escherichia coli]|uniref:ATP-grasp fold amidoligase family protein n=1 Tax=Escherichia coli TaxID=562 RepID=UPI00203CDA10|nr:ATP-grasp fold amidoligase family protein [Escherichia coli]